MISRLKPALLAVVVFLICLRTSLAQGAVEVTAKDGTVYVEYTEADGQTIYLADDRRPSLYTQNFGDCLGNSAVNITRFDAAYYQDNSTVLFHLEGSSGLANESIVMYIGVYAYGENRFELLFNPCHANIARCV